MFASRVVDIFVPPEQVIDTVDLYYLENRQRRLSLRFLTWFVLKENIQLDTHDSIEDSLSALKLYKVHLQLEAEDTFDNKLDELYREGRQYVSFPLTLSCIEEVILTRFIPQSQNFKPPVVPGTTTQQTSSPPPPSGPGTPIPHIGVGRGGFLQQRFNGTGSGHYPLNAVATPPFFAGTGSNPHFNTNQNWRTR